MDDKALSANRAGAPEGGRVDLRQVVLPPDLIGKAAPCDIFNARGALLVRQGAVISASVANPFGPTRVFCPSTQADRISNVNPIHELQLIGQSMARIADRLARNESVSASELTDLARKIHDAWAVDADACLGFARLHSFGRSSIGHVIHASLLVAELAAANRMQSEQITSVIGGALTMNVAKLVLHDYMHACTVSPSAEQMDEADLRDSIEDVLASLSPREEKVIRMRYGIGEPTHYSLEEIGARFALTRERIRQIEIKALKKLRLSRRRQCLEPWAAA